MQQFTLEHQGTQYSDRSRSVVLSNRGRKALRQFGAVVPVLLLTLLLILSHRPAAAQNVTSSLSGTITDATGAVVPNAKVDIQNDGTGQAFSVTTDERGSYTLTNIQPGNYTVNVSVQGFQAVTQKGVAVDPNIGRQINIALKTGSSSTTITVEADVNALQTESASVGQLVTSDQVKSIALNGRNPIYLSQLEPGVTRNSPLTSFNFTPDFSGPQISGARNDEISVTLDGAPMIRTRGNGTTTGVADVDSVSSMQVLSTTYPAQYGGTSGGILAQVPKTGTREFHGSVFEYLRNSFFNANTWVNKQSADPTVADHPSPFRFNQFGWNLTGPIAIPHLWQGERNKLFFFAGQEYLRYRQSPTQTGKVPSALMRAGNFSELLVPGNIYSACTGPSGPNQCNNNIVYQPGTVVVNPTTGAVTGTPYAGNVVPTAQLSPNGVALMNAFPLPNQNQPSYNWEAQNPYPQNQRKDTATLDYLPTESQQIRFSFLHYDYFQNNPFAGNFDRTPQIWHWPDEVGVVHWTWTITPTTVNDLTVSGSTDHVTITDDLSSGKYDRTKYGINFPYLFAAGDKLLPTKIPTIEIQNFTTLDGGPYPSHSGGIVISAADNLTKIIGSHTITVGGSYSYSGENNFDQIDVSSTTPGATNNQNGQFGFTNQRNTYTAPTTNVAVANTALGLFDTYGEIGQKSYTLFRGNAGEFWAQDSWRATPKTVIEYGIRYSLFQPYYALWGNQSMFNAGLYDPAAAPKVDPITGIETAANTASEYDGMVIPGSSFPGSAKGHVPDAILGGAYNSLFHGFSPSYSPTQKNTIQPRLGITQQVTPTTVFRAGGGRFVQRTGISDAIQLGGNAPFQAAESITNGDVDNPGGTTSNLYPLQISSQAFNFPNPEAWAWSVSLEQDMKVANLTISYVGRRGIHLGQLGNINQLQPGTIQANPTVAKPDALRPYQGYSDIIEQSDRGSSNYNGMQVDLKRRLTKNVSFGAAYTWAKLLDYGSSKGYELPNYYNSKINYGPADFDLRNVLVLNYLWNIPYATHSTNRLVRNALGDWQLSGVTQAQTGQPFNITDGIDHAGVGPGAGSQLYRMVSPVRTLKNFGAGKWFDTTSFAVPIAGTFAPRGSRNQVNEPGFQSWNIALEKQFHVIPGHPNNLLTFRGEAFNFTNHPNLDNVDASPTSSTFGQVTTKGQTYSSARQLQFMLRYSF